MMGVDHSQGSGFCALLKHISDHLYGERWSTLMSPGKQDLRYSLILDLL